ARRAVPPSSSDCLLRRRRAQTTPARARPAQRGGGIVTWDYVIVGGGSAGCVLANRLSADTRTRVLLLEAGGADHHPIIHVPGLVQAACRIPGVVWDYKADPDPSRKGATSLWMAGRVIGGSSSINGVV